MVITKEELGVVGEVDERVGEKGKGREEKEGEGVTESLMSAWRKEWEGKGMQMFGVMEYWVESERLNRYIGTVQ